jgi:hypothetical protein
VEGETVNLEKFFSRRKRDAEFAREIEAHLTHEIDENIARGLSPEEARRQAHRKFGSPRRVREEEWNHNTIRLVSVAMVPIYSATAAEPKQGCGVLGKHSIVFRVKMVAPNL